MEHDYNEFKAEEAYLAETISQIEVLLSNALEINSNSEENIVSSKKEMWEDAELFSDNPFERLLTINQFFEPIGIQIASYESIVNKIKILKQMLNNTYFARVDFTEDGEDTEKIYIGRANIINEDVFNIYVYDWRAPVASIFYRFEVGEVYYDAPMGRINGNVSLKRQYEIKNGKLDYFFDANINIADEFLRTMLSENTSPKMKAIVETIQRNQDMIIRDMENDLLIVQGVAGSGKTSVALHRVAYLMYQGLTSKLKAGDIIIISPNDFFSQYISDVLPDLGETNIESLIFEELCKSILTPVFCELQTRNQLFESLITCDDFSKKEIMKSSIEFKASKTFITILGRFIEVFENQVIEFEDIYYDDVCIFDKQFLRDFVSKKSGKIPLVARLGNLEIVVFEKVREMRKTRIVKLENLVREQDDHVLEVAAYARLLSIQESAELLGMIRRFTEIDYLKAYKRLFKDKVLFYQLAEGLILPKNIENILQYTSKNIQSYELLYEDGLLLSYLKAKLTGIQDYYNIKQVVVDEAQDYYPIHFELLRMLFVNAKYTILGDVNQTIEKETDLTIYNDIELILNKEASSVVSMSKSFRCTSEILDFSEKFIENKTELESFNRHGEAPKIIHCNNPLELEELLIAEINESEVLGYESIGVLCRSDKAAKELYSRLKGRINIKRIVEGFISAVTGVFIIPVYLAKGLEFDSVLIYGMNPNSNDEADKKLLYIASTRALHRLSLFDSSNEEVDLDGIY